MVKRTQNQKEGYAAEQKVLSILSEAGWAGEKLGVDFGEDLGFITFFNEKREPFRVFAQVKSKNTKSKYVSISTNLLRIWQASIDVHLLLLVIPGEEFFRVFIPNMLLDPIEVFQTDKKSISFPIKDFYKIDNHSLIDELTWLVRFEALERGHSYAQGQAFACQYPEGNSKTDLSIGFSLLSVKYIHHFLNYSGFTSSDSNDVFELSNSSEAEWIIEYGRKICSEEIKPGLIGESMLDDIQNYIVFEMNQKRIPNLVGDCLLFQAARWLHSMVSLKLKNEGIDISKLENEFSDINF